MPDYNFKKPVSPPGGADWASVYDKHIHQSRNESHAFAESTLCLHGAALYPSKGGEVAVALASIALTLSQSHWLQYIMREVKMGCKREPPSLKYNMQAY